MFAVPASRREARPPEGGKILATELLQSGAGAKTVKEEKLSLLCERLVAEGLERLQQPRGFIHFTGVIEADELLNNLEEYPHAFVIACIMDRVPSQAFLT